MRIVTFNVRSLRDDAAGVARVLRSLEPDIALLQEAPRLFGWRLSRRLLARRARLRLLTRRRACGNLILAGPYVRLLGSGVARLPRRPGLHRRAVVHARVLLNGRELVVAGTHLDLDAAARLDSARRVRAGLPAGPLVLGADVNDEPGSPAWDALALGMASVALGPTFPSRGPRRRIDALLVGPALEVLWAEVVASGPVSDHLAVCAELRWREAPAG